MRFSLITFPADLSATNDALLFYYKKPFFFSRLNDFITDPETLPLAKKRLNQFDSLAEEERDLVEKCVKNLGLVKLERDLSIPSEEMIECCTRLLQYSSQIEHLTHGAHFLVDRYYSVESDGTVVIPYNWKENNS